MLDLSLPHQSIVLSTHAHKWSEVTRANVVGWDLMRVVICWDAFRTVVLVRIAGVVVVGA